MSFEAMLWAVNKTVERPAQKLTLLILAERSGTESTAWPSVAWLADKTGLDRKTVISALDSLEKCGCISDTGERKGSTGGVKVYRLNLAGTHQFGSFDEIVPKTEQYQNSRKAVPLFPSNSTTFPYKQYQKRDTEPVIEPVYEPVHEPKEILAPKFDEFWKLYPNAVAKKKCLEKWTKSKFDAIAETILDDVRRRITSVDWTKEGGKYIPMSTTYLNQERWNDKQPAKQKPERGMVF